MKDNNFESIYFRNLRNAWYHELVLNHPRDDFDLRTIFAPWKIIQCYYCVLAGISALIRCFHSERFDNFLILDEPTDGFSQQQVNRMQEIFDTLNTAQMIIISHERTLDSFITDIFTFKKGNHQTKVVKEIV